ncbi:hypothetical protein GCM10011360_05620 [Primorskyibacter flagellatus]|uniref:Uncharacterized protein n=1 Tax=Primorskyibacter flagellatus TaxID=1387277 RepID=A0A917EBB0_9RHOB|nr:hypothetical protein [Primorskyibacter flagellatus]GGE19735.1 hypothetical protein GCM10011360_05620 [Primorskyibacter flagellatus]
MLALAGFVAVQAGGQQLMLEGPGTTPNAKLAADRLGLDRLAAEDTPKVPLSLSEEAVLKALPKFAGVRIATDNVGGYDRLVLRFANAEEAEVASAIVRRIPPKEQAQAIRMEFALFSAPLDDIQRLPDGQLDLLGALVRSGDYAVAVKGSFVTLARGQDAPRVASVLTKLLFAKP